MKSYQRLLKTAYQSLCQSMRPIVTALEDAQDQLGMGDEPMSDACVALEKAARKASGDKRMTFAQFETKHPGELKQLFQFAQG